MVTHNKRTNNTYKIVIKRLVRQIWHQESGAYNKIRVGVGHSYREKGTTPGDIQGRLGDPFEASTPLSGLQGREPLTKEPSLTYGLGSLAGHKTRARRINKQTNIHTYTSTSTSTEKQCIEAMP